MCSPLPEVETSWSKDGTDTHTCLERFGRAGYHKRLQTETLLRKEFPLQTVMYAGWTYDQIMRRIPKGADVSFERKVKLGWINPDFGGTLDVSIIELFGTLEICDLKAGAGVMVEPGTKGRPNLQLASYALAVAHEHDYNFNDVKLTILQPRIPHPKGLIRTHTMTVDELTQLDKKFKAIIRAAENPRAPLVAGEHCRFCRAKDICSEYPNRVMRGASSDFDNLTLED